ncbi:MAG TPA: hypothetical protein VN764_10090 [Polyangiaceae bacterium]|nr:hypothetical protein [Polyangiaceae bacterium]
MTPGVRAIVHAPPERLGLFRWAVGTFLVLYLLGRAPLDVATSAHPTAQFAPVGLPAWLGLEAPLPFALTGLSYLLTLLAALAFTVGVHFNITGPLCALGVLWVTSYKSSFGMVFHSENLLTLQVLLLACSPAAQAVSLDGRQGRRSWFRSVPSGWPLMACCLLTILAYLLAGIAKLKLSGVDFMTGEVLRVQIAYDNLRKIEFGSLYAPLGVWSLSVPALFPVLGTLTLIAELGGVCALLHPRAALAWALLVVGFHVGVLALMAITFAYPLSTVPFLCFFALERFSLSQRWVQAWLPKRAPAPP